ncbi:hypothetical protein F6455_18550 [Proteobacteria bacterium 005FR1]|nr:hypothetical protein [Proteobacteria bacterium 005FR1]
MRDMHLVMHGIAVKKYGTVEDISSVVGLAVETVKDHLDQAVTTGRVNEVNGKFMLTPIGQITLKSSYAKAYASHRDDPGFMAAYEEFEKVNTDLKQVITDWQTMKLGGQTVPNDHSDSGYDSKVIDRLGDLHERVETVLDRLSAKEPRLKIYKEKLLAALEKAEDGDIKWVSDASIESYHTVWFELHEDLLRIVGRNREE